jgi:hypothetical protein
MNLPLPVGYLALYHIFPAGEICRKAVFALGFLRGSENNEAWRSSSSMIPVEAFRTGQWSIPGADLDELPPCCWECSCLAYKEFSVGDGLYYYYCSYSWQDNPSQPPCLK